MFMFNIPPDRSDQMGNEIEATRQLSVDLRERVPDTISFVDEAVVDADHPEHQRGNDTQENQE